MSGGGPHLYACCAIVILFYYLHALLAMAMSSPIHDTADFASVPHYGT